LPQDNTALLALERQMASDVEEEILSPKHTAVATEDREASFRESQNIRRVRSGLAAQPAPGMEQIFEHWLQLPNDYEGDAIAGLKNLNSKESRQVLAKIAETPNKPNSHIEEAATYTLADMGDATYLPLMVQLLASPNERVRRAAIQGVGNLGGDAAVPVLLEEVRTAPNIERMTL
jgi:HEAT repeat protein